MWKLFIVLCLTACFGCGSGVPGPKPVTGTPRADPSLSEILKIIVETGEVTGETHIEEAIEKLRTTDATKAKDLENEYGRLTHLEEPDEIKQQANRMLTKFK